MTDWHLGSTQRNSVLLAIVSMAHLGLPLYPDRPHGHPAAMTSVVFKQGKDEALMAAEGSLSIRAALVPYAILIRTYKRRDFTHPFVYARRHTRLRLEMTRVSGQGTLRPIVTTRRKPHTSGSCLRFRSYGSATLGRVSMANP